MAAGDGTTESQAAAAAGGCRCASPCRTMLHAASVPASPAMLCRQAPGLGTATRLLFYCFILAYKNFVVHQYICGVCAGAPPLSGSLMPPIPSATLHQQLQQPPQQQQLQPQQPYVQHQRPPPQLPPQLQPPQPAAVPPTPMPQARSQLRNFQMCSFSTASLPSQSAPYRSLYCQRCSWVFDCLNAKRSAVTWHCLLQVGCPAVHMT